MTMMSQPHRFYGVIKAWCDASALIRGWTAAGQSHVLTCVAKRWHKDATPVSPVQLQSSTPAHASALCECATSIEGLVQRTTTTQVPLPTGEVQGSDRPTVRICSTLLSSFVRWQRFPQVPMSSHALDTLSIELNTQFL